MNVIEGKSPVELTGRLIEAPIAGASLCSAAAMGMPIHDASRHTAAEGSAAARMWWDEQDLLQRERAGMSDFRSCFGTVMTALNGR